jgi:uncharacterized lipoprotein
VNLALRIVLPVLASAALVMQGCAVTPQNIALDPPVQVPQSQVGQGKVVHLTVRDARPRKTLGVVGDLEGKWAHVSIENDLTIPVYQRVAAALQRQGFMVQPTPGRDDRKLDIEVREIEYDAKKEGFTYRGEAKAAVAAVARNGDTRYEWTYRAGETSASRPTIPSEADNVAAVNRVVAATLEDMLNDDKLRSVLVR